MSFSPVVKEYGMLFATPGRVIDVGKGDEAVDSEVIFELVNTGNV